MGPQVAQGPRADLVLLARQGMMEEKVGALLHQQPVTKKLMWLYKDYMPSP